jgi:hypothetical protein
VARLEILSPDGKVIRSFDSETIPTQAKARIYFAETWLAKPKALPASAGHHRFAWTLRYLPPPTLESQYSIAATPGEPTPILPEGAFVLPGTYTARLTAGGQTVTRTFDVVPDPRVQVTRDDLVALLGFQQQVRTELARTVRLYEEIEAANETANKTAGTSAAAKATETVARSLTDLAIDLEHADSAPTSSQRDLLEFLQQRFEAAENEWKGLRVNLP